MGIETLLSIKSLYGSKLGASDGEIGQVKDFYFDDTNWAVRYLVADTGAWLPGRKVLLSPHALSAMTVGHNVIQVNLTRKKIEGSPSIDTHKPVSRQSEEAYYQYYGWPYYWQGAGLWGATEFPILHDEGGPASELLHPSDDSGADSKDKHLRSTQAVRGYHLQTPDGIVGHVCDFMIDANTWAICRLVIKTGHRFSGKEVQISPRTVNRISYEDSTVYVTVSSEAVEQSPPHQLHDDSIPA